MKEHAMLSFFGHPTTHCDRVTRRGFLTAGAMGVGGLTLVDLLRAEAQAGIGSSRKAVCKRRFDTVARGGAGVRLRDSVALLL